MELTNQSSIVEAPTITKKMSTAKKATIALMVFFLALLISQGVMAAAPTSGDFLYGVYNEVVGWLAHLASSFQFSHLALLLSKAL